MKENTRTQNSIRNSSVAFAGQLLVTVAKFVTRTVFIKLLSEEYLGLGGLFSSILSLLALSELGIGSTLLYFMYKPCAEGDTDRLRSILALYKRVYTAVGGFVLLVGFALTPALPLLIKEMPDIKYINLYYMMYVIYSASSYLFSYKRSILLCYQQEYITSIADTLGQITIKVLQILTLIVFKSYLIFLIIQVVCTVIENIIISVIAEKKYPFIREKNVTMICKNDLIDIFKKVTAMFSHKIGFVVVMTTDNLIISKVLGLSAAGLYSNYYLIVSSVQAMTNRIVPPITASIGNLVSLKDEKETENVFAALTLITNWLYAFCAICLVVLFQDFIIFWIGESMLLPNSVVYILGIDFMICGMRMPIHAFKDTTGTFYQDRFKPLLESVVNLAASIPLTYSIGLAGVKLGTIISSVCVAIPIEVYVLYKYYFKKSCVKYVFTQLAFTVLAILTCVAMVMLSNLISGVVIVRLLFKAILCIAVPNVVFGLIYFRTKSFKLICQKVHLLVMRRLGR